MPIFVLSTMSLMPSSRIHIPTLLVLLLVACCSFVFSAPIEVNSVIVSSGRAKCVRGVIQRGGSVNGDRGSGDRTSRAFEGLRNGCASGLATVCAKVALQPFDAIKTVTHSISHSSQSKRGN